MGIKGVKLSNDTAVLLNRVKAFMLEDPNNKKVTDNDAINEALGFYLKKK